MRGTLYVAVALLALAAVVVLAAPASLHFGLKGSGGSTNNATSGRTKLISGGLALFAKRPLEGYGSGSFETEYERHSRNAERRERDVGVAHDPGDGRRRAGHHRPGAVRGAADRGAFAVLFRAPGARPPRIAIAACFAALVLHTWTYADFLEDPLTWTLLGIGVALARAGPRATRRSVVAREAPRSPVASERVLGYLKRLVTTGAAYQFGDILAKGLALLTLPLYTRHLSPSATAPPNRC